MCCNHSSPKRKEPHSLNHIRLSLFYESSRSRRYSWLIFTATTFTSGPHCIILSQRSILRGHTFSTNLCYAEAVCWRYCIAQHVTASCCCCGLSLSKISGRVHYMYFIMTTLLA
jgi:hypothetical protein